MIKTTEAKPAQRRRKRWKKKERKRALEGATNILACGNEQSSPEKSSEILQATSSSPLPSPVTPAPFAKVTSPDSLGPPSPLENVLSILDWSTTSGTDNQSSKDLLFQYETACDRESREFDKLSQIQCNQRP